MADNDKIIQVDIEDELKSAYIDYAMSVIVSRALPDVRDGLKPVHRRVLYGMMELGVGYNKSHKKSARIVGEVLGKYHPHGDSSVYDTMVRMAQDWSLRYPLVDGQGNFGSMDGDSPAAMRYTEARLARIADELLTDIDKETVDFEFNFDDTLKEPTVLPSKIPNLLINGASGIAVGMATNMLPHNLTESIDGCLALLDNPDLDVEDLMKHVKAPDFPTGGIILGIKGIKEAYETGRGRVVLRGRAEIVQDKTGRESIIISEIPFQVNKATMIVKMAELVNDKKIEGISDLRDESDRHGVRVVVDLKRDAVANVVLSKLYSFTPLQTSYGINNVCLVNGRPEILPLKRMIEEFLKFRIEVIVRRTKYELRKAEERAHILEGYLIALDHLDEVIALIRGSKNPDDAKAGLISKFGLSEIQAKAILEMRLQRLTGLERDKIRNEYNEIKAKIDHYKAILGSEDMQKDIVREELLGVQEKYGDDRRTEISYDEGDISIEDLIANDDVVITISHLGYIKRTKLDEFRAQGRGGRGSKGSRTRQADFIEHLFTASNHDYLLLFTEKGRCYWLRVYEIPEAAKGTQGRVIQNILELPKDDKVKAYLTVADLKDEETLENNHIIFATKGGVIKKTALIQYSRPRSGGINAITIREGDMLIDARLTSGSDEIVLGTRKGKAIRFSETKVRPMGRTAAGVRGVSLDGDDDWAVGMIVIDPENTDETILVLSEKGMGKRSDIDDYRITNRGGKGVKTLAISAKTGGMVAIKKVTPEDDLMIIAESGVIIRMSLEDIRVMGRATQGVKLIKLDSKDSIADVTVVRKDDEDDETVDSDHLEEGADESDTDAPDSTEE